MPCSLGHYRQRIDVLSSVRRLRGTRERWGHCESGPVGSRRHTLTELTGEKPKGLFTEVWAGCRETLATRQQPGATHSFTNSPGLQGPGQGGNQPKTVGLREDSRQTGAYSAMQPEGSWATGVVYTVFLDPEHLEQVGAGRKRWDWPEGQIEIWVSPTQGNRWGETS